MKGHDTPLHLLYHGGVFGAMQKITYNIVAEVLSGCQTEPISVKSDGMADTAGKGPGVF